jgi:hypothetical protein
LTSNCSVRRRRNQWDSDIDDLHGVLAPYRARSTPDRPRGSSADEQRRDRRGKRAFTKARVMKPRPSRTFNPLHFDDLDPHRFEDLLRQLVYGFRNWNRLEAIGRSGADAGVDIRGVELHRSTEPDEEEDESEPRGEPRVWFIQCKREKQFGPSKARAAAEAALMDEADPPHGFILAVPCDLSRQTRDALASQLRGAGVREIHTWGRQSSKTCSISQRTTTCCSPTSGSRPRSGDTTARASFAAGWRRSGRSTEPLATWTTAGGRQCSCATPTSLDIPSGKGSRTSTAIPHGFGPPFDTIRILTCWH